MFLRKVTTEYEQHKSEWTNNTFKEFNFYKVFKG